MHVARKTCPPIPKHPPQTNMFPKQPLHPASDRLGFVLFASSHSSLPPAVAFGRSQGSGLPPSPCGNDNDRAVALVWEVLKAEESPKELESFGVPIGVCFLVGD